MGSFSKFQILFGFGIYYSGGQPIMAMSVSKQISESQWETSKIPIKANGKTVFIKFATRLKSFRLRKLLD